MFSIASGFLFQKQNTGIQKLDPRIKLFITIVLFTIALITSNVFNMVIVILTILSISIIGKVIRRMIRPLLFSCLFATIIFSINFFSAYFFNNPITFEQSVVFAIRFIAVIGSSSLFFLSTSPDELEHVMRWFKFPRDIIFAFVTAIRFVPVLMLDTIMIMDAQKSRGLELEQGNVIKRVKNFVPILIPLIVNAIIRSGELAEAMESRAYGTVKKPTCLHYMKLKKLDYSVFIFSNIFFIFFVYYFVLNPPFSLLQVNI